MNIARVAAVCAIVLVSAAAQAGPRDDLIAGMAKCAALADNTARLACYDALNPTVKAAQAEPPPPAPPPAPVVAGGDDRPWYSVDRLFGVSPANQRTPEQFGSENLAAPTPPPGVPASEVPPPAIDSITAKVTEYSFKPDKKFVVFLENGQIWEQLQGDTGIAHFDKSGPNTVTIVRGFLGSYNLHLNDSVVTYKVKRLK